MARYHICFEVNVCLRNTRSKIFRSTRKANAEKLSGNAGQITRLRSHRTSLRTGKFTFSGCPD